MLKSYHTTFTQTSSRLYLIDNDYESRFRIKIYNFNTIININIEIVSHFIYLLINSARVNVKYSI